MLTSSNHIESSVVRRASRRPTKVFKGQKWVNSVAYFPDGQRIASGSNDKTIIIWNVVSGRQDGQPIRHDSSVGCIAVSPDGRRIASGMQEGGLVIWDAMTREVIHELKGGGVHRLVFSPDGRWIATAPTADERKICLWDADTGRPGRGPLKCDGSVYCVAFSPDGSRIAAGFGGGSFQVIDISTGVSVVGPIKGHKNMVDSTMYCPVSSIVYSPDGRLLVTASWDKSIRAWDSQTGVQVGSRMGHEDSVLCVSLAADGRRIASGGWDETVRVWDLETQLQVGDSFDAHGRVLSVAFSPDARYIISGGDHDTVCLLDTDSLGIQSSPSPPTASNQKPAPLRRQRQAHAKSHNDTSSITSSLLDLHAVVHQQPATQRPQTRQLSFDDWDTESIRPRLRQTEPQQDSTPKQGTSTVQPVASGRKWSRNIRERWRDIRHHKSRVPVDPPHLPLPLHKRANIAPAPPELPTNQQARPERDADTQENTQASHSRTRPSRNQGEANVAFGKLDERLFAAPPRGRKGRRHRARAQRGGVRSNPRSDTESQDSDSESEYVDTGCLDAICFGEYFERRRYLRGR